MLLQDIEVNEASETIIALSDSSIATMGRDLQYNQSRSKEFGHVYLFFYYQNYYICSCGNAYDCKYFGGSIRNTKSVVIEAKKNVMCKLCMYIQDIMLEPMLHKHL